MSIWGKVIGGVTGFALGGPFGAMMGAYAGHLMVDRNRFGGMNAGGGLFGAGRYRSGVFGAGGCASDSVRRLLPQFKEPLSAPKGARALARAPVG